MLALGNAHHPEELVDVIARVADDPAEDDQHVVHVQCAHDLYRLGLVARHRFANLHTQKILKVGMDRVYCARKERHLHDKEPGRQSDHKKNIPVRYDYYFFQLLLSTKVVRFPIPAIRYRQYHQKITETYQGDMTVIPSVIVHQSGPVPHAGNLVPVVPPGHHAGFVMGILSQPVIRFTEIIQDGARPEKSNALLAEAYPGFFQGYGSVQ